MREEPKDVDGLIAVITEAITAYSLGHPVLTDAQFDYYWLQLRELCPESSLLIHTSSPKGVGDFAHPIPVLGLAKTMNSEDFRPFIQRFMHLVWTIQPKYDGCSLVYYPDQEVLATSGDGKIGQDVSAKIPLIHFPEGLTRSVRYAGEAIIPWSRWDKSFGANPRNVVSGWFNRKEDFPAGIAEFLPYCKGPETELHPWEYSLEQLEQHLMSWFELWNRTYPMDGLVISVQDPHTRMLVGHSDLYPHWAIAWKRIFSKGDSRVTRIEWAVSRTNRIFPTIIYDPIELAGTINTRATGNSARWTHTNQVGPGALITVAKAGEIIPQIVQIKEPVPVTLPTICPFCGSPLELQGAHLICTSDECFLSQARRLQFFYNTPGTTIKGLGPAAIDTLLTTPDIGEELHAFPWRLLHSESAARIFSAAFSETEAEKLFAQVLLFNNHISAVALLAALGIQNIGLRNAQAVVDYLLELSANIPTPEAWRCFLEQSEIYESALLDLYSLGVSIDLPQKSIGRFSITGEFSIPRMEIVRILSRIGWTYSPAPTKQTDVVFLGKLPAVSNKQATAIRYRIPFVGDAGLITAMDGMDLGEVLKHQLVIGGMDG